MLSLFFNNEKGPLFVIFYGTKCPLCVIVPLNTLIHSYYTQMELMQIVILARR